MELGHSRLSDFEEGLEGYLQPFDRQAQAKQGKGDKKQRVASHPQIWDKKEVMHKPDNDADSRDTHRDQECIKFRPFEFQDFSQLAEYICAPRRTGLPFS